MTSEPRPAALDRGRLYPRVVEALRILSRTGRVITRFTLSSAAAYGHSLWATPMQAIDPGVRAADQAADHADQAADHPELVPSGSPLSEDEIFWQLELRLDADGDTDCPPGRIDSPAWWLFWP